MCMFICFLQRPPRRRPRHNKQGEEERKPESGDENQEQKLHSETVESNEQ